jgi:HEAT repeats
MSRSKFFIVLPVLVLPVLAVLNSSSAHALTPEEYKYANECFDKQSIPHCLALLKSSNPKLREDAVYGLGKGGTSNKAVLPHIFKILSHPQPKMRQTAAFAFGNVIEPEDSYAKPAIPQLVKMLSGSTKGERVAALFALARVGNSASTKSVIKYIIPFLSSSDELLRQSSVCDLKFHMSKHSGEAVPYLFRLLKDKNPSIRGCSIDVLRELGYKVQQ